MRDAIKLLLITAIAAMIVLSMASCDDGNDLTDPALNGTWVNEIELILESGSFNVIRVLTLNNGKWENSYTSTHTGYNGPYMRGFYSARNGIYSETTTHYSSNHFVFDEWQTSAEWITAEQYFLANEQYYHKIYNGNEELVNLAMDILRNPTPSSTTYSVRGSTLTMKTTSYTKFGPQTSETIWIKR